jgi:hypothetical protein
MVALLTAARKQVSIDNKTSRKHKSQSRLTRPLIPRKDKRRRSAVQLRARIEDELIRRQPGVCHCRSHVCGWAVDDIVAEEILALPERAVIGLERVELVETGEERRFGGGEEGLQVGLGFGGGGDGAVAVVIAFLLEAGVLVRDGWWGWGGLRRT